MPLFTGVRGRVILRSSLPARPRDGLGGAPGFRGWHHAWGEPTRGGTDSVSEESGGYTASQRAIVDLWEEHTAYEFEAHSTEKTLATMTDDPVNINVPLLTGGVGLEEVRRYYSEYFIPNNPPDTEITLLSRTVGEERVVDELILSFTHTTQMDWMLPGVPPT